MGTSLPFHPKEQDPFHPKEQDEEGEEGDWLELGLGFNSSFCRKKPILMQSYQQLGLRFDNESVRDNAGSNHGSMLQYNHHGHVMSSWEWQMNSDNYLHLGFNNRQLPVAGDAHDCGRRPQVGLWFTLRPLINGDGEALPQVSKAYIRVKRDENVTVFMVKTYLVIKLGLSNEAEIDISCMGQKLLQTLTLKQVKDTVWVPRFIESISNQDISFNPLMTLDYGRASSFRC